MSSKRYLVLTVFLLLGLFATVPAGAQVGQSQPGGAAWRQTAAPEIEGELLEELARDGQANMMLYFSEKADLSPAADMDWEARGRFVMETLQGVAARSQAAVQSHLDGLGAEYKAFWIDNIIVVAAGDQALLDGLHAFSEIAVIRAEPEIVLIEPDPAGESGPSLLAVEPNISHVNAPDVWALGIEGEGITVASIDTGVRFTHQALISQYRGNLGGGNFNHNYQWWNPYVMTTEPSDSHDHGSHVTGTMVGDDGGANQIGMAPGAKWIACRGFNPSATSAGLLECAQFMAAPWDLTGANADPDRRPHVVNNSWGNCTTTYDPWYQGVIDSWHAAGVYPVFSNGNSSNCGYPSPPGLNTVGNPARYGNVSGVGSTGTSNGQYATHSNWGPTDNPDTVNPNGYPMLKPQFMAPGVSIRSSTRTSNTSYANFTGTSMSAPHVAGLIALMWQAGPCLVGDYATTETLIEQTATPIPYDSGGSPPPGPGNVPNYATGWGEINALAAVQAALGSCGLTGTLTGTVTDADTNAPLAGAQIVVTDNDAVTKTAVTDGNGEYVVTYVPAGSYEVSAQRFGYLGQTAAGVVIEEDETTVQDFALVPAESATISGTVTDVNTGWPLYAQIAVDGVPDSPYWNDPVTGFYSITLPEGATYDFTVTAFVEGYLPEAFPVGPVTGNMTVNVALDVNAATCIAPGYQQGAGTGDFYDFEADDGGFVGTLDWEWGTDYNWTGAGCDGTTFYPPPGAFSGSGMWGTNLNGCYANSGAFSILSISADLAGQSSAILQWWDWYDVFETFDYGEVRVNGTLVYDRATSYIPPTAWEQHQVDLTPFVGGMANIEFRVFATTVVNRAGWYVDDVLIGEPTCTPQAGGLVVGNVYDDNTGATLTGAQVANDSGYVATAVTTPADPAVDDAFYTLFTPEGPAVLTATYSSLYGADTANLVIADGTTTGQDFALPAGWIVPDPPELEATVELGQSDTLILTLSNMGGADADFSLSVPFAEEDFESAFPPDDWTVINNGGNCVWRRNDQVPNGRPNYAGGDGFTAAADSDRCGSGTTMNTELHSPVFDLSGATTASLNFVASYRHLSTSSFRIHVSGDGGSTWDTLLSWTASVHPTGPGFPVSLDLSDYAGSSNVVVSFHYTAPGWHYWAQVDQVRIVADAGPWFSVSPSSGTIPAGDDALIDVNIDTSNLLEPGTYTAAILVVDSTPYDDFSVPLTVHVTTSPTLALLEGTVLSQGYCDNNPFAIAGAEVIITSGSESWTRYTNAGGYYYLYLDESYGPVDVSVTAAQHQGDSATGVVLIGGGSVEQDFDLRWLQPCIDVAPDHLATTLTLGDTDSQILTLGNMGAVDLTFELVEIDGGYTPAFTVQLVERANPASEQQALPRLAPAELAETGTPTGTAVADPVPTGPAPSGPGPQDIGDNWETMAPMPAGRVFNAVVADQNGYVYVIGGTSDAGGLTKTSTNYRYNTADNTWMTMAPLPVALSQINAIEINNKIYVPGDDATATTYVYDIAANSWSNIPANGGYTARAQYQIVALGTDLYVLGGITAGASTTQVWKLDTTSGTWTAGVPMQRSRTSFSAAAIDGVIYVAGGVAFPGFAPDMTAEKFDGAAWSYVAGVPGGGGLYTRWSYNADGHGADGLWLAAGRRDVDWNVINHAGFYDPASDTWTTSPTIPTLSQGRVYMEGDVASDGYFYVIGGRNPAGTTIYATNERLYVGAPGAGGEVEWLDQDPTSGSVAPDGGELDIVVTFDAGAVIEPGEYYATIRILSNDPVMGTYNVPVTMVVTASAEMGLLNGTVQGLGYCDEQPGPLADAEVLIEGSAGGSWSVTTNASGYYSIWIDEAESPLTVTVSAAGHVGNVTTGIVVTGGQTTNHDVDLRSEEPCLNVSPDSLSSTQAADTQVTLPLTLSNLGAGTLVWSIDEAQPVARAMPSGARAVLYDNGPLVTHPGAGPGGSDHSTLQNSSLGMILLGSNVGLPGGFRMADDFTVSDAGGWIVDNITFYAYQTGSPTTSTFTHVNYQIWDGPPDDPASSVIFGDTTTNRMVSTDWTNAYRVSETTVNTQRPIMDIVASGGFHLPVGTYWVDWQLDGTLASGPWQPPITIIGQTTTGDAMQFASGAWQPMQDGGTLTAQGAPFTIEGNLGEPPACDVPTDVPWLSVSPSNGSTGADSSSIVSVTLDSTGLSGGSYEALLCVNSNDAMMPLVEVPVTLTVEEGASYGVSLTVDDDELFGMPGEMVMFDLRVTNMGNVPDMFELYFEDNEWVVELSTDMTGVLQPDEWQDINVMVYIPAGATMGNWDTVMVYAKSMGDPDNWDNVMLKTVTMGYGVTLSPETVEQSGMPGELVEYSLTLTNMGNMVDSFDITGSGGSWVSYFPVTVIEDLEPDQSAVVSVFVLVPADAAPGAMDTMMVTATSQGDPAESATSTLTTVAEAVPPTYGVELTPAADAKTGAPGATVIYTLQLKNTGSVVDTITLGATGGWAYLPVTEFVLDPDESATVAVHINIPAGAGDGDVNVAMVTAVSGGDPSQMAQSELTTTVVVPVEPPTYGVTLAPATAAATGRPGATVTYLLTLTNVGEVEDTFMLTATGWATLPVSSFTLASGASTTVVVHVNIPAGAADGATNLAIVTATSSGDPSKMATSQLTTTVEWYRIFMPVIMKP